MPIIMEVDFFLKELPKYTEPIFKPLASMILPATSEIVYEPYGVALIISPFNFPINLSLVPIIGAIASGNCVLLKPSELSTNCEKLLCTLIPKYMDGECIKVITGGIDTMTALLDLQWDKIFFTGSTRVGKIVAKAAANYLTPVSLELGGKCPVVIDSSVTDLELATKRILWGKIINAGQMCVAPDYVLCHASKYEEFLDLTIKVMKQFYNGDASKSPDFGRIITKSHCERLEHLIDTCDGKVVIGGNVDFEKKYVDPTIIRDASMSSTLMTEEIFGPILPVFKYESLDEAIQIINSTPLKNPLALYVFGKDRQMIDKVSFLFKSYPVFISVL